MKAFLRAASCFLLILSFHSNGFAAEKLYDMPRVEYSADSYMETADMTMTQKIYYAYDKERWEQEIGGEKMTTIIHRDKKVMWMLMPEEMMYVEISIKEGNKGAEDLSEYKFEETTLGEEVINGMKTTKSKIIMTGKKDMSKMEGFWWRTKEGIVVKMEATAADKDSKTRFKQELRNIHIGKQDAKLFEIPAGYSKFSIPSGGGFNMKDMMR